jgi:hypothetical protein
MRPFVQRFELLRGGETAAAVACGIAAALLALLVNARTAVQFGSAVGVLAVAVVVACWLDWRRTGDKISVLTLIGLFYLLAFVAGSVYVWFNPSFGLTVPAHQPFSHAALTKAEWLCVFSWVALAIGYRIRLLAWLPIRPLRLKTKSVASQDRAMIALYCVGIIARVGGISRGLYFHPVQTTPVAEGSTLTQIFYVLGLLPSVAVAYVGVRAAGNPRLRRLYQLGIAAELIFAVPSGNRVDAVTVLVLAVVIHYYTRHRFPVKAIAVSAVFALFFVFPVLYLYRTSNFDRGYHVSDLSGSVETYTSGGLGNTMLFGIGSTLSRFSDIRLPAALEERGRGAYPVSTGETIPWLVTNYVPHAVDPSKRSLIKFNDDLAFQLRVTPVHNSSFAITQPGEMYLDFGLAGAVIAVFILGSVYRELNEWLRLRRESALVLAIYAAFAYPLIQTQESLFALSFGGVIRNLIVVAIIIRVTTFVLDSRA